MSGMRLDQYMFSGRYEMSKTYRCMGSACRTVVHIINFRGLNAEVWVIAEFERRWTHRLQATEAAGSSTTRLKARKSKLSLKMNSDLVARLSRL